MDIGLFDYVAPGALILSTSSYSIINFFNPSEEKHSSLYFGSGLVDFIRNNQIDIPITQLNNFTKYIIEFNTSGMRIIPLGTFISGRKYVKIYYFMEGIFPNYKIMKDALSKTFVNISKEYGFSKNKTYCFKMIADCYYDVGITVRPFKILGKYIYLSQSFSEDYRWYKVVDTTTGVDLITRDCYYFIGRVYR
ncbi:ORF-73 [Teiidae poxvirus 1]|nr:ORF-73 [Teiidae poxvirus 1]